VDSRKDSRGSGWRNCVAYGSLVPLQVRSVGGVRGERVGGEKRARERERGRDGESNVYSRSWQGRYPFGAS